MFEDFGSKITKIVHLSYFLPKKILEPKMLPNKF